MNQIYSLTILGKMDVRSSGGMITHAIYDEFRKIPYIRLDFIDCLKPITKCLKTDFILYIGAGDVWKKINKDRIKAITNCIKITTMLEVCFPESDWNYVFKKSNAKNSTKFSPPICKKAYPNLDKIKNTILIDHPWQHWIDIGKGQYEQTDQILSWLEKVKSEFKVTRIVRNGDDRSKFQCFQEFIPTMDFNSYIDKTNTMETFVATHRESFGYSVVDMVARGIRVIAPLGYLDKKSLVEHFGIKEFSSEDEFLNILREPIDKGYWNNLINKCSDYADIVKVVDSDFKRWKKQHIEIK